MHLTDEFRLCGAWSGLAESDIAHFNEDFERVLRLLLINSMANVQFLKEAFHRFCRMAVRRLDDRRNDMP